MAFICSRFVPSVFLSVSRLNACAQTAASVNTEPAIFTMQDSVIATLDSDGVTPVQWSNPLFTGNTNSPLSFDPAPGPEADSEIYCASVCIRKLIQPVPQC
jgi:hypothetical protein